ncbi:rhomboid family intramembrane serine protease [Olivibacter sitiensis]|uniref:rhomboid family intramembrane serine protease n=1 Tax=Olivibacter sitiensis TaxID=376470 RepID=UPI0004254771|nr:rhomboid family intramembrane serine protease [Olivibacter sitiensis]
MNKSVFSELYYTAFRSGNPSYTLIAVNVLIFLVVAVAAVVDRLSGTAIWPVLSDMLAMPSGLGRLLFRPWTLFTNMFVHFEVFHLLFNMLWLYWMGNIFLDFLNNRQFLFTYLAGGLLGSICFLAIYNLVPSFAQQETLLIGASGCIYAVVAGAATLVPDYTIRLLFFGNVRLKYLAIAFTVLSVIGLGGGNVGGNVAHLAGALFGFIYIKQLQRGNDWSKMFKRKKTRRLKVVINERPSQKREQGRTTFSNQEYIDSILDKISKSGYASLSKEEKDALFKASKQD